MVTARQSPGLCSPDKTGTWSRTRGTPSLARGPRVTLRCDESKASHRPATSDVELRQLRAFVAVAENASVTEASRVLGIAQSTLSEALAALERAMSTSLVQRGRGPQGAVLTPAGHALLPHAQHVLAAVARLHVAVADTVASARGVVELVTNESISTYVLPRVLASAREHWPNTQFPISIATLSPTLCFINWVEASGATVSQVLNFETRQVWSFATYAAGAGRQALLDRGTITIDEGV